MQPWATQCFGTVSTFWEPVNEDLIDSAHREGPEESNIYQLDLSHMDLATIYGLRLANKRAIRAKYPNGNPELTGPDAVNVLTYAAGWIDSPTTWVKPADKWNETMDVVVK